MTTEVIWFTDESFHLHESKVAPRHDESTDSIQVLYCIENFLEWPKYKLQGPLEKQDELTNC